MVHSSTVRPWGRQFWNASQPGRSSSRASWDIYTNGNNRPEAPTHVLALLEEEIGQVGNKGIAADGAGDLEAFCGEVSDLERDIGFRHSTAIEDGIARFAPWYREFQKE